MTSNDGTEIRVLAATGVCGSGFREASLAAAMRRQPHFIGCDNALAFKASIPRPNFQGDLLDSDNRGGPQYAPLMDIEIPGL